jgi:hypothetical protein
MFQGSSSCRRFTGWLFSGSDAGGARAPHSTPSYARAGSTASNPRPYLPRRRDSAYRQPSDQPARCAAAMEHAATGDAKRRPLSRTSSSGRGRSPKGTLTRKTHYSRQSVSALFRTWHELPVRASQRFRQVAEGLLPCTAQTRNEEHLKVSGPVVSPRMLRGFDCELRAFLSPFSSGCSRCWQGRRSRGRRLVLHDG